MSVIVVSSQYQMFFKRNTAVWPTDNSVNKQTFLAKNDQVARACRTYGYTHEHGVGPSLVGGPWARAPSPPLNPALDWRVCVRV